MAWLRRVLQAARTQPAVTIAAVLVLVGSAVASAAIVVATDDDGEGSLPPTTTPVTTTPTTTTTTPPTTTSAAPTTTSTTTSTTTTIPAGQRCLVRLHGKGNRGADTYTDENDVKVLTPDGNDEVPSWGGLQWLYFPNGSYNDARDIVADALDDEDCDAALINGFSNGAAFAAKLFCRGETFDGRVVRYVIDDPVVDRAVEGCDGDPNVAVTLYWTGALDPPAVAGWDCEEADWTCEGGETIGIDAYADAIGVAAKQSKNTDHRWYQDAPELADW